LKGIHYGHEQPGKELHFRTLVNMRDQLPDTVVKCGWMLGVEFPKKGPIKDVTMLWIYGPELEEHGEVVCDKSTCRKTGPDGIATLVFKPKNEVPPYGVGGEYNVGGGIVANAFYLSRHRNVLGWVNQIITPKTATFWYQINFHLQPYELEFDSEIKLMNSLDNAGHLYHVKTKVPLVFGGPNIGFKGQAPLEYVKFDWIGPQPVPCTMC